MPKESIQDLLNVLETSVQALGGHVNRGYWLQVYLCAKETCSAAAKLMQRADVLQEYYTSAHAAAAVDRALENGKARPT